MIVSDPKCIFLRYPLQTPWNSLLRTKTTHCTTLDKNVSFFSFFFSFFFYFSAYIKHTGGFDHKSITDLINRVSYFPDPITHVRHDEANPCTHFGITTKKTLSIHSCIVICDDLAFFSFFYRLLNFNQVKYLFV